MQDSTLMQNSPPKDDNIRAFYDLLSWLPSINISWTSWAMGLSQWPFLSSSKDPNKQTFAFGEPHHAPRYSRRSKQWTPKLSFFGFAFQKPIKKKKKTLKNMKQLFI